jgi:hypothetical protein
MTTLMRKPKICHCLWPTFFLLGLFGMPLAAQGPPNDPQEQMSGWPILRVYEDYAFSPVRYWFELRLNVKLNPGNPGFPATLRGLLEKPDISDAMTQVAANAWPAAGPFLQNLRALLSTVPPLDACSGRLKEVQAAVGGRPDLLVISDFSQTRGSGHTDRFELHMAIELDQALAKDLNGLLPSQLPAAMDAVVTRGKLLILPICKGKLRELLGKIYFQP